MARHDVSRQASAAGSSDMTNPVAYWRTYLGGAIGGAQLLSKDVDGDGHADVVMAVGGEVVAKHTDDTIIWKTDPRGIYALATIADVDGDGTDDVIAYSGDHVVIFSAKTGALEWTEPDGEIGAMGAVRVGDVNGDGKVDVVNAECGCCGVNSGKSGFIWSFGGGFGSASSLGMLPVFTCGTSYSLTLLDADGTPPLEILTADSTHFALARSNGSIIAQSAAVGSTMSVSQCATANIDGVAGDEAVCLLGFGYNPQITTLHYNSTGNTLDVLWTKVLESTSGSDIRWVDPVVDLDGDGQYELVVSTSNASGWHMHVFDALTGNELITPVDGQIVSGTAPSAGGKRLLLSTSSGSATGMSAWAFVRAPQPALSQLWQLPSASPVVYANPDLLKTTPVNATLLATDLNGDGVSDLVTRGPSGLIAISTPAGQPTPIASTTFPAGVDALYSWLLPPVSTTYPQVGVAGTDGVLSVLDNQLKPTHATVGDTSKNIAIHIGGYYASGGWREMSHAPRVASLDGSKNESILVVDSRQALNRFDGTTSSYAIPPAPSWAVTHTFTPTIVANMDGTKPAAACVGLQEPVTNPPSYRLRLVRTDGSLKWDVPLEAAPLADLVSGKLNGDGVPDLAVQWGDVTGIATTKAISGVDGATLWATPTNVGVGGLQSPGLVMDKWNGDAFDDILFQGTPTRVLSGQDGSLVGQGGSQAAYGVPIAVDTNGDGVNEYLVTSEFAPVSLYSHDLQTALWTSTDDDRPYPHAGVAQCGTNPSTPTLVQGSWANPARLKVTPLRGTNLGAFTTFVLAGGKKYANEAAAKGDGKFLGQLTAANVHANLTGAGHPTAVVGSSDGWLYAVNPCDGSVDFAVNFGAPVGEATFGDTDGDGRDEILVTTADGYLYDLKNENIAKPGYVWDTDPAHGITDHDVDTIVTTDSLSGTWEAVTGATGYEATVVTKDGKGVPNPVWQNVGIATSATLSGLALQDQAQYFFVVRALSAKGPSVDALSNGVVVTVVPSGDAGAEAGDNEGGLMVGGCSCEVPAGPIGSTLSWGALGAVAVALGRLRRRQARR